jgi:hypothetical protein
MATRRAPRKKSAGDPNCLAPEDLIKLLGKSGAQGITLEMLRADLAAGAPANGDRTINLVHYVAWLVRETGRGNRSAKAAHERAVPPT